MALDFSVIVPSYNRPRELASCLGSLAALDFPKERFEVIVVDDGSDEPAAAVAARFAGALNIRSIRQTNQGPASARNAGARAASGTFLAFTDDDCAAAPGWLSALLPALRAEHGALAGGRTVNALTGNACAAASQLIQDFVYAHYNATPGKPRFFASNNIALAADVFREADGFDPRFRTAEDRDFCDRHVASGRPMIYVPTAVIHHSHHLTVRTFWNQHVAYGRGARRFQLAHSRRDRGSSTLDPGFYTRIARQMPAFLRGKQRPWTLIALMAMWQMANLTGFALETLAPSDLHRDAVEIDA